VTSLEISGRLLARNSLLNFIGQVVPLFVGVVTIPFIVRGLGTDRFGLLSLAWVILGYFTIFDLGLGRATAKFVAEALGKGAEGQIPRLFWTAATIQAVWGLLGAIVLVSVTPLLVERILNISPELRGEAQNTFYVLAFAIPVVLVSSSFSGVLEAAQRFDLVNAVRSPFNAANFLLPLVGVFLGWGLPRIAALLVVSRGLAWLTYYWRCIRVFPSLKGLPHLPSGELRALVGFGGWITISQLAGMIFGYLDRILIGSFLSIGAVTYYAVPYDVISRFTILPASLTATLFPAFSNQGALQREDALHRLYLQPTKFLLVAIIPLVSVLVIFSGEILELWLGADFAQRSITVFRFTALAFFFNYLGQICYTAIQALGRPDLTAKLNLAEIPLFIGLCWNLIPVWGINGGAFARCIVTSVDALLLFCIMKRLISLSLGDLFSSGLFRGIVPGTIFCLLLLCAKHLAKGLLAQAVFITPSLGAYALVVWFYWLDGVDKAIFTKVKL